LLDELFGYTGFFSVVSLFFFSSRRRHTRSKRDWSSDVCSSDLLSLAARRWATASRNSSEFTAFAWKPGSTRPTRSLVMMPSFSEIGRASCRERVEIAVGGGAAKKKGERRVAHEQEREEGGSDEE